MLKNAVLRTQQAVQISGIVAILLHALFIAAKGFYRHEGFVETLSDPMTLLAKMINLKALLTQRVTGAKARAAG